MLEGVFYFSCALWQQPLVLRHIDPLFLVWITSCQHDQGRQRRMRRCTVFPPEIVSRLREALTDGFTCRNWDRAFNIAPCHALFCNRLVLERRFESELDVLSIAEWEYNKQHSQPPFSVRHHPAYYLIEQTETGFKMTLLKKHPYTRYHLHYPLYTDPLYANDDYLPCQIYSILDYERMGSWGKGTPYATLLSPFLKKRLRWIRAWFDSPHRVKKTTPGWDPQRHLNPLRHRFRGQCWLYPAHQASATREQEHRPCIQWSQTLFDLFTLQQTVMGHWRQEVGSSPPLL